MDTKVFNGARPFDGNSLDRRTLCLRLALFENRMTFVLMGLTDILHWESQGRILFWSTIAHRPRKGLL